MFVDEYSCAAVGARVAPLFEELLRDPPPLPEELRELVDAPTRLLVPKGEQAASESVAAGVPARQPGSRRWRAAPADR